MGKHESRQGVPSPRQIDGFSRRVSAVTHARRFDEGYSVGMGEIASISLVGSDARALDKIARKLQNVLDPDSSLYPSSPATRDRLLGSLLTISGWSEILKRERRGERRSLRETSADERNSTRSKIKERRHDAFRESFNQAVEGVLSGKESEDMVAVALLAAGAVASADQMDLAVASSRLQWLRHETTRLSESDPEFGALADISAGILDVVTPIVKKTEVLFAA